MKRKKSGHAEGGTEAGTGQRSKLLGRQIGSDNGRHGLIGTERPSMDGEWPSVCPGVICRLLPIGFRM